MLILAPKGKEMLRIIFCISFLIIGLPQHPFASHLLGSQIQWEKKGTDQYLVSVQVLRECSGKELVPPRPEIWCKTHNHQLNPPVKQKSVHTKVHKPSCDSYCTACASDTCNADQNVSNHGFKSIKATYHVDLSNINCCKIKLVYENCCRPTNLTTIKDNGQTKLYTSAWFDRCKAPNLSGNALPNVPQQTLCVGNPSTLAFGSPNLKPEQSGYDSFRYKLVPPKKGFDQNLKWKVPFTYKKPMRFEGFPDEETTLPAGFHLDAHAGVLRFIATMKQQSALAVGINYYKNGQVVAFQKRDLILNFINCKNKKPPVINKFSVDGEPFDTLVACGGDTTSFSITGKDSDGHKHLRLNLSEESLPGKFIEKTREVLPNGKVKWQITWLPADTLSKPYAKTFPVTLTDGDCPVNSEDRKAFYLKVLPRPTANFTGKWQSCKRIRFKASNQVKRAFNQRWFINGELGAKGKSFEHIKNKGKYTVQHQVEAGQCKVAHVDTFNHSSFPALTKKPQGLCKGDTFETSLTKPSSLGPDQEMKGRWTSKAENINVNGHTFAHRLDSGFTLSLKATITNEGGETVCQKNSNFRVKVNQPPDIKLKAFPVICENQRTFDLKPFARTNGGDWQIDEENLPNHKLSPPEFDTGLHTIAYTLTDSTNQCATTEKQKLRIKALDRPFTFSDTALCFKNDPIEFPTSPEKGKLHWEGKALFDTNQGVKFDPEGANLPADTYKLTYHFKPRNPEHCAYTDSLNVSVFREGQFKFSTFPVCPYDSLLPKKLTKLPAAGYWKSPYSDFNLRENKLVRKEKDSGLHAIPYHLNKQCQIAPEVKFNLIPEQPIALKGAVFNNRPLCENLEPIKLKANPAGGQWSGRGIQQEQAFDPKLAGPGQHVLSYKFPHKQHQCFSIASNTVHINPAPTLSPNHESLSICPGQPLVKGSWQLAHSTGIQMHANPAFSQENGLTDYTSDSFKVTIDQASMRDTTKLLIKASPLKGCDAKFDSIQLIKRSKPKYRIKQTGIQAACKFVKGKVSLATSDSFISVRWHLGNEEVTGNSVPYHFKRKGKHNLGVKVTNQYHCKDTTWKPGFFRVLKKPIAEIKVSKKRMYLPEAVNLKAKPGQADSYHWSFFKDQTLVGQQREAVTRFNPEDTGNYEVILSLKDGTRCTDTAKLQEAFTVLEKPVVYIPEAFTPDGDGLNDQFRVEGQNIARFQIKIYSRSGALLYKSGKFKEHGWDGRYRGGPLPTGSYWYKVTIHGPLGGKQSYAGTVQLVR